MYGLIELKSHMNYASAFVISYETNQDTFLYLWYSSDQFVVMEKIEVNKLLKIILKAFN